MKNQDKKLSKMGFGVDLEDVGRFRRFSPSRGKRFLERVYTEDERVYCFSKKNSAESLAARFVGKEAVIKALSAAFGKAPVISHSDIEIKRTKFGAPEVFIKGRHYKNLKILVSLSHTKDLACAAALAFRACS